MERYLLSTKKEILEQDEDRMNHSHRRARLSMIKLKEDNDDRLPKACFYYDGRLVTVIDFDE